ncbi:MAG: helix-turn-helix domain-containing protein [Erythrobacter sp.]
MNCNDQAAEETYWILRRDQLECLTSPVRADIVDHLSGRGALTVRELSASLGRKPSSLYYHLELLIETGLVLVAGEDNSGRRPEALYRVLAPRMRARRALAEPANREVVARMADAALRQASRDFERGLARDDAQTEGPERKLGFYRSVNRCDPATLAKVNEHLDAIAELLWSARDEEQPLLTFAWAMAPTR